MPRPSISTDQKKREGAYIYSKIAAAKETDPTITQELIALEIGITQGNVSQWINGKTAIPDKHLIWLGEKLGFDPADVRPSLRRYSIGKLSDKEAAIIAAYKSDPQFRRSVDTIAEMSAAYRINIKKSEN